MPRIQMDEGSAQHVSQRLSEHFADPADQEKMVAAVKKLLTLWAPPAAVGHYQWHVNVGLVGRVVLRGYFIRTVYPPSHNFPGGTEYRIIGGALVRA